METTIVNEIEETVVVVNEQPEFIENDKEVVNARYFVLSEKSTFVDLPKNVGDCSVCGLTLAEWVARACPEEPIMLSVQEGENVLDIIRPYATDAEYSVVLYANTPLVVRAHIVDMLGFVYRKRLSACKLKKGFIFRNDYVRRSSQILSVDTYDFSSIDLFEVKTSSDLGDVQSCLEKRLMDYHTKNQVEFASINVSLDASVEIGFGTTVCGGASILDRTEIGTDSSIGANVTIENSKIGNDVTIGAGAVIKGSVIKDGAIIEAGALIIGSVVGEKTTVCEGAKIVRSGIKSNATIGIAANLLGARIAGDVTISQGASVISSEASAIVLEGATIGAGACVCDVTVSAMAEVPAMQILKKTGGE